MLHSLYNSKAFNDLAFTVAQRFVTMANTTDAKTWRQAARGGSHGQKIFTLLDQNLYGHVGQTVEQKILENAHYIRTLPLSVAGEVTSFVQTKAYESTRASDIAKLLQEKVSQYTKARTEVIARTEASKAMTALTESRAREFGVNWYQWRTADDARVRNSHRHMEGVLVRWDDPPSPEELIDKPSVGHYNAGNVFNCRCYPSPVINIDRIHWPAKVYYDGKIQVMSKEQFKKIA